MSLIQPFRCVRRVRNRGIENGHDPNFHLHTLHTHTHTYTIPNCSLSPLSPFYSWIAGTIIPLFLAIKRQEDANSRRVHERVGHPREPGAKWSRVQDTGSPLSRSRHVIGRYCGLYDSRQRDSSVSGLSWCLIVFRFVCVIRRAEDTPPALWNFVNIEIIFFLFFFFRLFDFLLSNKFCAFICGK